MERRAEREKEGRRKEKEGGNGGRERQRERKREQSCFVISHNQENLESHHDIYSTIFLVCYKNEQSSKHQKFIHWANRGKG